MEGDSRLISSGDYADSEEQPPGGVARRPRVHSARCVGTPEMSRGVNYNAGVSGGFPQAGKNMALSRALLSVGTIYPDRRWRVRWEVADEECDKME